MNLINKKEKNIIMIKYKSKLNLKETQKAIKLAKDTFENKLSNNLNLLRVSAPLFVFSNDKINDDLGDNKEALNFNIKSLDNKKVEIVQSLAKWKRMALKKYNFKLYEGLYTDMNAIRANEIIDNTHSIYVDQWDWELIIKKEDRNLIFLKNIVTKIIETLYKTKNIIKKEFPKLTSNIKKDIYFISSQELKNKYPNLSLTERENEICKKHKTVFIYKINPLSDEQRAPDYDDWNLNGDILIWHEPINEAIEISSMGIRVDKDSLLKQIKLSNRNDLLSGSYHKQILNETLPLTIGGGIGQSRICMILLEKYHIAEVQASLWSEEEYKKFHKLKINYL